MVAGVRVVTLHVAVLVTPFAIKRAFKEAISMLAGGVSAIAVVCVPLYISAPAPVRDITRASTSA